MKYVCSHCGTEFEPEKDPPRCPSCLRKHGLMPADQGDKKNKGTKSAGDSGEAGDSPAPPNRWIWGGIAAAVVVSGVVAGIYWYRSSGPKKPAPLPPRPGLGPAKPALLTRFLEHHGISAASIPIRPDPSVTKWAAGIKGKDLKSKARALMDRLDKLKAPAGRLSPVPPAELKSEAPMSASALLRRAQSDRKTEALPRRCSAG